MKVKYLHQLLSPYADVQIGYSLNLPPLTNKTCFGSKEIRAYSEKDINGIIPMVDKYGNAFLVILIREEKLE